MREEAAENYKKTRKYIVSPKGALEAWSDGHKRLTGDLLNGYAGSIVSAASKNGNLRGEGVFEGVTEVIEILLKENGARSALSKTMEMFTLIVDLHAAAKVELFGGNGTKGLTDCI